ncbi:DUF5610 domain-containing protein [Alteromonas sp.]|nr:DUF5610 domain-containing protein [Alteromonas sp.]
MNVSQIKAFMGDQKAEQKASVHPNEALKKQLQQDGLEQAAEFTKQQAATVSVSSTQTSIGLRVFSSSMNQNLVVDGKQPSTEVTDKDEDKTNSLFDFEKIAKNVMRFVGGVIRGAADAGAGDEKLNSLFSQARDGVSRGFAMAEKDLAGFMNKEIEDGMTKSRSLIDDGINELERDIFNPNQVNAATQLNAIASGEEKSGSILIRTRDGDEVTLSFESRSQFNAVSQTSYYNAQSGGDASGDSQSSAQMRQQSTLYEYFEKSGISFSLKGELDEDELKAISALVEDAQDLADDFFSGNVDKAFSQALELGFDDKELVGYALQLNRTTQSDVVKAYENIQHYSDKGEPENQYGNIASPVSQYIDKMVKTFESAERQLQSNEDYNALINGIINEMKDVQVPDLVSAINRFHSFNKTLLNALPQPEGATPSE